MRSLEGAPVVDGPSFVHALVVRDLDAYRRFVRACMDAPALASTECSYSAPIFKGTPALVAELKDAHSAADKLDAYFRHTILDEEARVRFGQLFRQRWTQRHPLSERQDLFVASGDIFRFVVEVLPPAEQPEPAAALEAIVSAPHDTALLALLQEGRAVDVTHLRATCKLFFDHAKNPRQRAHDVVQQAAGALGTDDPWVIEVHSDGALPGLIGAALAPLASQVGAMLVALPT